MGLNQPHEDETYAALFKRLAAFPSLAVAFSGGTDSTFLLATALRAVNGPVRAFTITSPAHARRELEHAQATARVLQADHTVIHSQVANDGAFLANGPDRCYYCKRFVLTEIIEAAGKGGIKDVAEGTTVDELESPRPGMRAVAELGVLSPLADAGLTKADVKRLSRELGIPNFDRPPNPCLATRIPTDEEITQDKLARVEAAEGIILDLGFRQVRCRLHGSTARIELGEKEIERAAAPETRRLIVSGLRRLGFSSVVLDLRGYRTGGVNADT